MFDYLTYILEYAWHSYLTTADLYYPIKGILATRNDPNVGSLEIWGKCFYVFWDSFLLGVKGLNWGDPYTYWREDLSFNSPTTSVKWFTLKVVMGIALLIVIRGGVPRYRYDFLTKMGWVKFLTLVVSVLYITFIIRMFW